MGIFEYYLIWVNVIGFFLYLFNMFLYLHTENVQVDAILTICSLIGGSAGILLAILLFDRKAVKDNMMSRVFIACVFVDTSYNIIDGKRTSCRSHNTGILGVFCKI